MAHENLWEFSSIFAICGTRKIHYNSKRKKNATHMKIVYEPKEKYTMFTLKVIIFETPPTKRDIFSWFSWIYFFKKKYARAMEKSASRSSKYVRASVFHFQFLTSLILYILSLIWICLPLNWTLTKKAWTTPYTRQHFHFKNKNLENVS